MEPRLTEPLININPVDKSTAVAPLAWVPWVPGNPSIFRQWVPEPINFGRKKTGNHLADYKKNYL